MHTVISKIYLIASPLENNPNCRCFNAKSLWKEKNCHWAAASCLGSKHDLVLSSFVFLRHFLQDNLTSSHPRLWLSRWFATKEKISSDEKWRSCTDHVLPGQVYMGPGQKRTQPVRTGSNVDFLCGLKLFLLDPCLLHKSRPPSPSLIGLQPDSCWQLSPPPEKLNELEKFPSINCTKSFAAGGATFLWENQSSSDAKKYHPTLTHTIHLTGILLYYAIFTSRINAKMLWASETVKICIYWWNKGNCSGNVTFFCGSDC